MKDTFSNRLKEIMSLRGISQSDLCRKADIPKSTLSLYVNGKREPRQDKLTLIANILNVSEPWLLGFDVPMRQEETIEEADSYYTNPDTAEIAQEIFDNRDLRLLFDSARDASPDDLKQVHDMLEFLKAKERNSHD